MKLVLSCEHATNFIPHQYASIFEKEANVLDTHEAYDPGTVDLFEHLKRLADYSLDQKISRLLIETNRSLHHPKLFSRFSSNLSNEDKNELLSEFYVPYRTKIENCIRELIAAGHQVFHLSLHSFTPVLNSVERNADIGLLYDPSRKSEKTIARELRQFFTNQADIKVRMNYPYLGKADGFTTYLRKQFPQQYSGIELEINQKLVKRNTFPDDLKKLVFEGVALILK